MTVHEDLVTQYHQQDTSYYCGAASAQMVLEQCGAGLQDQDAIYADNHSHSTAESGWYTAPDGLQWTLNHRQSSKYFCLDALDSEDAISRMIAWTIHHYRVSPIAMVYGWDHWIVVRGYTASATPSSSGDVGYALSGFDVNNPWPPTPSPGPPPPHSGGDACGGGGTRGIADEHLSYTAWRDTYMTGIPSGHWAGKFVAVCDPDRPPTDRPTAGIEVKRPFDGVRILDAETAARLSVEALEGEGLLERKPWRLAFDGARPGRPALVQRLDRNDSFYWITPMGGDGEASSLAVAVDARFGDYRQAINTPAGRGLLLPLWSDEEVLEHVTREALDLPGRLGRVRVRPELACVSSHWVWRPCRESLSPWYPFRLVSYGAFRFYVRSDGRVFSRLTSGGRGI